MPATTRRALSAVKMCFANTADRVFWTGKSRLRFTRPDSSQRAAIHDAIDGSEVTGPLVAIGADTCQFQTNWIGASAGATSATAGDSGVTRRFEIAAAHSFGRSLTRAQKPISPVVVRLRRRGTDSVGFKAPPTKTSIFEPRMS